MLKNLDYQIAKFTIFEPMVQMQVKNRKRGQGEKDFQSYALRAKKIKIDLEWLKNKLRIEISSKIPKKDKKIGKGDRDEEKKKSRFRALASRAKNRCSTLTVHNSCAS